MTSFVYFWHLVGTTFSLMAILAPLSVILVFFVLVAWTIGLEKPNPAITKRVVSGLVPSLITIGILLIGVAFVRSDALTFGRDTAPPRPWFTKNTPFDPNAIVFFLIWLHVPLFLILLWWGKGARWVVVANSALWAWVSTFAAAATEMSITGKWL